MVASGSIMTDNLTQARVPLKFHDGTEYLMSPLTDRDIEELDQWVRSQMIAAARDSIPKDSSEEEYSRTLGLAMHEAMSLTWMSGAGARMVATTYGLARLCYQSVKKNHPDVTLDELRKKMFDPRNIEYFRQTFESANIPKKEKSDRSRKERRVGSSARKTRFTGR